MRLDVYLAQNYPDFSRSTLQKLVADGCVRVNDQTVATVSKDVNEDDNVSLDAPEIKTFDKELMELTRSVIYEDDNVVVINKPAGVLTHAKGVIANELTVADFVRSRCTCDDADFLASNRAGIVHRLDRATSGVLIAAKNPATQSLLQRQFSTRKAHKIYLAIAQKAPKLVSAKIDLPIGRNPKKPSSFRVDAKGKPAITNYETKRPFGSGAALLELRPLTGRTHQLRVHLAQLGSPIMGDALYGPAEPGERMFLHASSLEITIPGLGENQRKTFSAPLPNDFQTKLDELERLS